MAYCYMQAMSRCNTWTLVMKTPKLPGKPTCPKCGERADGYTETELNTFPNTGDVCVCAYCGSINLYEVTENKVAVILPTHEELKKLLEQIPELPYIVADVLKKGKGYFENN